MLSPTFTRWPNQPTLPLLNDEYNFLAIGRQAQISIPSGGAVWPRGKILELPKRLAYGQGVKTKIL
jgi:hypothetical protein